MKKAILAIILILAITATAHEEGAADESSLHLEGYDISLLETDEKFQINKEIELTISLRDPDGKSVQGADVQGQILDTEVGKEIYYSTTTEIIPGMYSFKWKPSFAGDYLVQFIFRTPETILQPTYKITIEDPRAGYIYTGSIILAALSVLVGLWLGFKKKINIKPIIWGVGFGLIIFILGYSVSTFYQSGGEKGFVVCGPEGCDLAIHWHSQLHMTVCGEKYHLPLEAGDLGKIHTHKELDRLHYHALIKVDETGTKLLEPWKLSSGDLFEQLGIKFTNECFVDLCNGDLCPDGKPGTLKMTVNDVPNNKFNEYVWNDGDEIHITFD